MKEEPFICVKLVQCPGCGQASVVKVVVRACYGAYFVAHIFKYSYTIECGTLKCPRVLYFTARLSNYQCTFT